MDKVEDTEFNSGTVVAAKLGDQAAFETIYLTHAPAVSGYARGHGVEDPEALANETMYRVLRDIATFDGTTHDRAQPDHRRPAQDLAPAGDSRAG